MNSFPTLFSPFRLKNLTLANRVTMAPMYVGYGGPGGTVNDLVLAYYRKIGHSGASLIVVENTGIDPAGAGAPFMLMAHKDECIEGLAKIADVIHAGGAYAFLQLNHAGRFAYLPDRIAPSPVPIGDITPREATSAEIHLLVEAFGDAALRVKKAGFDGVELHGGTGYLLAQFVSPRLNRRTDAYGGSLEHRMRFALEVLEAVRGRVGTEYPVGYRLLADELLPGGFSTEEATVFAQAYAEKGIDYLSVMAGTYESFRIPPYVDMERTEGYMVPYARRIKAAVPRMTVLTAGRIQTPQFAENILREGAADLVGLARVLFADPLWPKKAKGEIAGPINACNPSCSLCMEMVLKGKHPFCAQWTLEERQALLSSSG
jgi:2,4-dienoyl-CoA reductase-like NADH-dependent reductase (Old Yellow Enzyme family)